MTIQPEPEMAADPSIPSPGPSGPSGMRAQFTLRCDATQGGYAFSADGKDGWMPFESLDAAVAYMGTLIDQVTPLAVCNESGKRFMVAEISPGRAR